MVDNTPLGGIVAGEAMSDEDAADRIPDSLFGEENSDDGADTGEGPEADAGEAEADLEDAGDESEDEEGQEQSEASPKIKLKGGEYTLDELEAKLAELERGGLREADYTRKTQEVAQARKTLETHAARISQAEADFNSGLQLVEAILSKHVPAPPDASMLQKDPLGYLEAKESYDAQIRTLEQIVGIQSRQSERQAAESKEKRAEYLRAEQARLFEKAPELKSAEGRAKFFEEANKHGEFYGLSPADIGGIEDHRALMVLKDAIAYRTLKATTPAVSRNATQPLKAAPRGSEDASKSLRIKQARQRAQQNPTLENIADAIPDEFFHHR